MENISNTDFDKLENLFKTKKFDQLSTIEKQWVLSFLKEDEYASMSELYVSIKKDNTKELEPNPKIKKRLDNAFADTKKATVFSIFFRTKMPVYQSAAVALLFLSIGIFTNLFQSKPLIVHDIVQVIKYIPKQVVKEVRVPVAQQLPRSLHKTIVPATIPAVEKEIVDKKTETINTENINPFVARQQEIAINNVQRVLEENNGISMGNDTVIRKMLVTVY